MQNEMEEAIKVLKNGGIVIFPTDTAFGIGCRIDNEKAIKRLFKIRKRPKNKPMLVLVDSVKMAQDYLSTIPQEVKDKLIKSYWPGKLTIILKCNPDKVSFPVRDKRNTLGVRFPDNKILLELIEGVGVPIVGPSANFSGKKTPFRFEDLDPRLVDMVDFVYKKNINNEKNVSTVIDCSEKPWKIIRKGAININL